MKDALAEAKAALVRSKDDMARYYDRNHTRAPDYQPGDMVYLEPSDIQTTRPSRKLSHRRLGPFEVVKKVGNGAYRLKLPPSMSRLHPVFNVVKLLPAPPDPFLVVAQYLRHLRRSSMVKRSGLWKKFWTPR
jgi:hypothetical protein